MKYEVIIFDADETLFDFRESEKAAIKNTMLEHHMDYDENYHLSIYTEVNTAIWKEFENGLITQKELKIERFRRFSDKLNVQFDENKFAKSYMKHLSYASFLYENSLELIESLYEEYKLLIITNGLTDVQDRRIRKSTIGKYFETIIISEEVGVSKPDSRIFELVLDSINYTDKNKVLMVGDSLTSDIQGGINSGIDTCWFNPNRAANNTEIKPTYEIYDLMELRDILNCSHTASKSFF